MKWNGFFNLAAFMAILLTFSTSCMKEDPIVPDYVGTWTAEDSMLIGDKMTARMDVLTLTETSFFYALQIEMPGIKVPGSDIPQEGWADLIGVKGTISFIENVISRMISEIGIYSFNPQTGLPTGTWKIYQQDHADFYHLLQDWGLTQTTQSKFTIVGPQLTLQTDLNKDGDYKDENETMVYMKETS